MWYGLIGLGILAGAKALEKTAPAIDASLAKRRERKELAKAVEERARQQLANLCATNVALDLERKRLEVEKLNLEIEAAKRQLETHRDHR